MDEKYYEQASELEADRRTDGLARIRSRLGATGRTDCQDCDKTIPAARREAMPSVIRCVGCQQIFEKEFSNASSR